LQGLLLKSINRREKAALKTIKGFAGRCIKKDGLANGTCILVLLPALFYA